MCVSVCSKHLLGELPDCPPVFTSGWRSWLCVQQTLRGPVMRGTNRWTSWRVALTRLACVCMHACVHACVCMRVCMSHPPPHTLSLHSFSSYPPLHLVWIQLENELSALAPDMRQKSLATLRQQVDVSVPLVSLHPL